MDETNDTQQEFFPGPSFGGHGQEVEVDTGHEPDPTLVDVARHDTGTEEFPFAAQFS